MASEQVKRRDIRPRDHDERMAVAMRVARWELGSGAWAGRIIGAYLWPDEAAENLAREMGDTDARGEGPRVLLDFGKGKYHFPYPGGDTALCGYNLNEIRLARIRFEDEVAPEDICKKCSQIVEPRARRTTPMKGEESKP